MCDDNEKIEQKNKQQRIQNGSRGGDLENGICDGLGAEQTRAMFERSQWNDRQICDGLGAEQTRAMFERSQWNDRQINSLYGKVTMLKELSLGILHLLSFKWVFPPLG